MGEEGLLRWVAEACGGREARRAEHVQSLWSGYGEIFRARVLGAATDAVVVKWVRPPSRASHPRGWASDRSHRRKLRSYAVERVFYERFAPLAHGGCRVPACLGTTDFDGGQAFVLEDLDAAGFDRRHGSLEGDLLNAALRWLAEFHATFMGVAPDGLWAEGTYWHLATRPDELAATTDHRLKAAASELDGMLSAARFRTLAHGDAKVANLCFSPDGCSVAAVDFQYVGGGCGMKDLAYLLSSCLTEHELLVQADGLVDVYFEHLRSALDGRDFDLDALEAEWRRLYPVAWADFARFLSGWAPHHWKLHGYTEQMVALALP
ncbi:MAG: phosphotransferase [Bradymonadia bacterium]